MDGKFDGKSFGKARSPMNSYPSDESIRPEEEQPKLDSEIDSEGNPNPPLESTPQLDVGSESGTMTVLTDGGSNPVIRSQNRRRILQEARKRRQYQEARWRKQNKDSACKLMLHMMEHAKTRAKVTSEICMRASTEVKVSYVSCF